MALGIRLLTFGIVLCKVTVVFSQTACDLDVRTANMAGCLSQIKSDLRDRDKFWFGTQYSTDCPFGPINVGCFNSHYPKEESVEERLFPDGLDLSSLDKYLQVDYVSEAGTYTACGGTFQGAAWQGELIPTNDRVYTPWLLRNAPTLTWDVNNGEFYTVIFYDVGSLIIHNVIVNIPGNDVASGEVLRSYNGPKVSYEKENVYMYFIYSQASRITVSEYWRNLINTFTFMPPFFTIPDFTSAYSMTGPVAVNWAITTGDMFAVDFMIKSGTMNRCPDWVSIEMDKTPRPFLPQTSDLDVGVDITFDNTPIAYTVCCKTTSLGRQDVMANPFGQETVNTALVRSENSFTVTLEKRGLYLGGATTNFTGDMYTLMAVDPDVPSMFASAGTQARPILHMMVVNIVDGDVSTGDITQQYRGPSPPNNSPHTYYFLLYKQEGQLDPAVMPSYAGQSCSASLQGRCLYDVNTVVAEQNLTLVGATWMKAIVDDYVTLRRLDTSDPAAINATCFGRPLYSDPCETSEGTLTFASFGIVFLAAVFTVFMQ